MDMDMYMDMYMYMYMYTYTYMFAHTVCANPVSDVRTHSLVSGNHGNRQ